jgi:hypothetical protein
MNNSNGKVNASYNKRLDYTATSVLLIWILIITFGIFFIINAVLLSKWPFILALSVGTPIFYILSIIGFFPSRNISFSLINLFKNRQWIEPSKFVKSIFIQLVIAAIASIVAVIFSVGNIFTEFFSMFFSFTFLFSTVYLGFCLEYFRYDLPERENYRNPSPRRY